jgi:hypothetical protein
MPTVETDEKSLPLALQSLFYKLQYSRTPPSTKELTKVTTWRGAPARVCICTQHADCARVSLQTACRRHAVRMLLEQNKQHAECMQSACMCGWSWACAHRVTGGARAAAAGTRSVLGVELSCAH